jgi:NADP-dependent 3-hydroxy acid dehydrogenase YdfG
MASKDAQVVVVTGASAGVGRATARRFADEGVSIALIARGRKPLAASAREVEAAGGRALVLPLDVADSDVVEKAAEETEEKLDPIDVWSTARWRPCTPPWPRRRPRSSGGRRR